MRSKLSRFDATLLKEAGVNPLDALHGSGSSGSVTNASGSGASKATEKVKGKLSPLTIAALLLAGGGIGWGSRVYYEDRRAQRAQERR